jgi:hypothetical protein
MNQHVHGHAHRSGWRKLERNPMLEKLCLDLEMCSAETEADWFCKELDVRLEDREKENGKGWETR